jgi:ABC-type polar amino acid transport system ATPase subunit
VTRDVIAAIKSLSASGIPILIVMNDMPMVRRAATHVGFLNGGKFIEESAAGEFFPICGQSMHSVF